MPGVKVKTRKETAPLSAETVDYVSALCALALAEAQTEKRDIIRVRLLLEEMLLAWQTDLGEDTPCTFRSGTRWGRHVIEVSVRGEKLDPAEALRGSETSSLLYSRLLAQAGINPVYSYKDGENKITISPHRQMQLGDITKQCVALLLAVFCGLFVKAFLGDFVDVAQRVMQSFFDVVLGAFSSVSSLVIFFAVSCSIIGIGDVREIGKLGKAVTSRMMNNLLISAVLITALLLIIFPAMRPTDFGSFGGLWVIYDMILGIVPPDIASPFVSNNALQIIFLGAVLGVALLIADNRAVGIRDLMNQGHDVAYIVFDMLMKIMPFFLFVCVFALFLGDLGSNLLAVIKIVVISVVGTLLVTVGNVTATAIRMRVPIALFAKKLLPTFRIALRTGSSAASFSENMETCQKKLGISSQVYRFAVPLGQVLFMPGGMIQMLIISLCMAEYFHISITFDWLICCVILSVLLSTVISPVPGGVIACCILQFAQLGIPEEAVILVAVAEFILSGFATAANEVCLQSVLVMAASQMGKLDFEILRK